MAKANGPLQGGQPADHEGLNGVFLGAQDRTHATVSNSILSSILNNMDAFLYISDPRTDQILFINDKMRQHFAVGQDLEGQTCWKVLQQGFTQRCDFCPNRELAKDPTKRIVSEEQNTVTGRFYRNTDCWIPWNNGELVHMQHSVDITEIKQAQAELEQRLAQQQLMATISQSFIAHGEPRVRHP